MNRRYSLLVAVVTMAFVGVASANFIAEWKLEKKAAESDLVVVGVVHEINPTFGPTKNFAHDSAAIDVGLVLKGQAPQSLVVTYATMSESKARCCVAGDQYIFFLEKTKAGLFIPVNSPHGIQRIAPNDPSPKR